MCGFVSSSWSSTRMARLSTYRRIHNLSWRWALLTNCPYIRSHVIFCCHDSAGGEDGADLVTHGCSTRLLKYLSNCCEGAGVEAENWMMLGMCSAWIFTMLDLTLCVDLPECTGPTLRCGSTRRTLLLLLSSSSVVVVVVVVVVV